MFLRKLKNRSGSISVQIISKFRGKYKVIKTLGYGNSEQEIQKLEYLGKLELERLSLQPKLFISETDTIVDSIFESLSNASINRSKKFLGCCKNQNRSGAFLMPSLSQLIYDNTS